MKITAKPFQFLAALGMSALLIGGATSAPAVASSTGSSSQSARDSLLGTWTGTYAGYNNGEWESGKQKFVFKTLRGVHVKGTWQYRMNSSQPWSKASPVQLIVVPQVGDAKSWTVTGADENGIYFGQLKAAGPSLDLTYQGSVNNLLTYQFTVTRKK